jgi:hypothetical protein
MNSLTMTDHAPASGRRHGRSRACSSNQSITAPCSDPAAGSATETGEEEAEGAADAEGVEGAGGVGAADGDRDGDVDVFADADRVGAGASGRGEGAASWLGERSLLIASRSSHMPGATIAESDRVATNA